jgi:drug/metabolite transporter (DMT)-like permease
MGTLGTSVRAQHGANMEESGSKRSWAQGVALIALSASAFGALGIFARVAYAGGTNVTGLLAVRFVIAGALLTLVMLALRRPWPRGRVLAMAIGMGAIGYVGQSFSYFSALNYAAVGLVGLLLYAYPTLVCLLSAILLGEALTARKVVLLVVSFAGLALMLGGGGGTAMGIALGLAAAFIYSIYIIVGARELGGADSLGVAAVVSLSAAAVFAASALVTPMQLPGAWWSWAAASALALFTVIAMCAFFAGLKRVGPSVSSIISTMEPVVTVALAWLILGETLAPLQLLGGALVLAAAARLAVGK